MAADGDAAGFPSGAGMHHVDLRAGGMDVHPEVGQIPAPVPEEGVLVVNRQRVHDALGQSERASRQHGLSRFGKPSSNLIHTASCGRRFKTKNGGNVSGRKPRHQRKAK